MYDPGAAVGEDDVVVVPQDIDGAPIVGLTEDFRHRRILFTGKHFQAAGRHAGVMTEVGVALDLRVPKEIAHGRRGRGVQYALSQRATVWVRVDCDDAVRAYDRQGG